ncbi:MAG: hypothetical protein LBL39_04810, partial [Planctomycetaceae bacterium]|nr:hypothetical protein [Planctomycetaceae bacterium]
MQYISISFLIVIFFCADIIFAQKYDLPNQHNWRVGDSWVIEMDRYYNDWMAVRATVNPKDEEDRICQTLLLQVTVSGEKIFDNKKCWELDYKTNCLPDRDTSETDLGQNRSYVSKDDGSLVCYQNATVSFPVPIEIIVNGVPYAFIGELPVQTIPWKYDCPANNNEPDVSGYKIKIDHTITKDGLDFIVYLRRSSFGNTGKIEKIIQRWNKKSNWWNEYEYWQYGTTRYHKSFFARLVKYIPADGFCEWHDKNGKKIADAKFAK